MSKPDIQETLVLACNVHGTLYRREKKRSNFWPRSRECSKPKVFMATKLELPNLVHCLHCTSLSLSLSFFQPVFGRELFRHGSCTPWLPFKCVSSVAQRTCYLSLFPLCCDLNVFCLRSTLKCVSSFVHTLLCCSDLSLFLLLFRLTMCLLLFRLHWIPQMWQLYTATVLSHLGLQAVEGG